MTKLEDGYHKWICIDHSHPHLFKDGKCLRCGKDQTEHRNEKWKYINHECLLSDGKCLFCGKEGENPHDNEPDGLLPGEIKLSPQHQKVFDFAVNYANRWDMFRRGLYKPTLVELDQFKAEGLTIRLDSSGNIIGVKKHGEEDEEWAEAEK